MLQCIGEIEQLLMLHKRSLLYSRAITVLGVTAYSGIMSVCEAQVTSSSIAADLRYWWWSAAQ